jgi:hypothetical protein
MENTQLLNLVKTGDIIHVHTSSILGEIIRLFEKIRYGKFAWSNHTAIITIENGFVYINEANPKVMKTLMSDWMDNAYIHNKKFIISRIPETYWKYEMTAQNVKNDVDSMLGTKYNYADIIISCPIFMLTGKWLNGFWNDGSRYFCSQFVSYILNKYTLNLFKDINLSPSKIYEMCSNYQIIYTSL